MRVRLTQLDGKLPNLALMKLASWHRGRGDEVIFTREAHRDLFEGGYDRVYGSAIFAFSTPKIERFLASWPGAILGGTGTSSALTVEDITGGHSGHDYSLYPSFTPSIGFTQRGCRLSCKFCLTPETLIITADGLKKISDIKVGDLVLTHKGRYRRVTKFLVREHDGDVLTLMSGAISSLFPVKITGEHPVWTRRVSYRSGGQRLTSFNWRDAKDIRLGYQHRSRDKFAYPRTIETVFPEDWKCPGAPWLPLGPEAMTLIGWYLAEGYVSSNKTRGDYETTFCLGHSNAEMAYAEEIKAAGEALGLHVGIRTPSIGLRPIIHRNSLAAWLKAQFGTGASTKVIPFWVRQLPPALLENLLAAWAKGDGWFQVKKGRPTWKITTVSANLAVALREIALRCGYDAMINRHRTSDVIQGRRVQVKNAYTVIYGTRKSAKRSITSDAEYVYGCIGESKTEPFKGLVYNLEVDEDNSYCTPAFALHNCVVPAKEGRATGANTIAGIWRGEGHPKHLQLLDNDFFGQPGWRDRIAEIRDGGFKVCFNQGINVRLVDGEIAAALASIQYMDDQFKRRRLYTAWDNLKDEKVFFRGVDLLEKAGVSPRHLMVYMLCGFAKDETIERIQYRFDRMVERGMFPYPMVYDLTRKDLKAFQRWAVTGIYRAGIPFAEYNVNAKMSRMQAARTTHDFFV